MSEWKFINRHNEAIDFTKPVYWSDSFLESAMLYFPVSPVSNQNNEIGLTNTDLLPNARIRILADTDDGYQCIEIVLSRVKVFSPPIFFDTAPEIIFNDVTLKANREIKVKFSTLSDPNLVCHEMATKIRSIEEFQSSPENWGFIDSLFGTT